MLRNSVNGGPILINKYIFNNPMKVGKSNRMNIIIVGQANLNKQGHLTLFLKKYDTFLGVYKNRRRCMVKMRVQRFFNIFLFFFKLLVEHAS